MILYSSKLFDRVVLQHIGAETENVWMKIKVQWMIRKNL